VATDTPINLLAASGNTQRTIYEQMSQQANPVILSTTVASIFLILIKIKLTKH
jgi:hypothetical protein